MYNFIPQSMFYPDRKFKLIPGMDNLGMQVSPKSKGDCKGCRRKNTAKPVMFGSDGFGFEFVGKELGDIQ